jgi:hypothetical protein
LDRQPAGFKHLRRDGFVIKALARLRTPGSRKGFADIHALVNYRPFRQGVTMIDILQCLKKHGQRLDLEIAKETGVPLAIVRERLAGLAATGAVITCNLTRFENGKSIEAWQCRVSGYVPPLAPGRKAKQTT